MRSAPSQAGSALRTASRATLNIFGLNLNLLDHRQPFIEVPRNAPVDRDFGQNFSVYGAVDRAVFAFAKSCGTSKENTSDRLEFLGINRAPEFREDVMPENDDCDFWIF